MMLLRAPGCPWQFLGFRVGGLTLFSSHWYPDGRRFNIASWHNRKHMCWLWFLDAYISPAKFGGAFKLYHTLGPQARTCLQVWRFNVQFCWQAEGWYSSPSERRMKTLLRY